jgi:hypothetical protein
LLKDLERNQRPLSPKAERGWSCQFHFATARGRAGYEANRGEFAESIWEANSPKWRFDQATFERSAASFDHPDDMSIVIHNYRWRLSLAPGERQYDALEARPAARPGGKRTHRVVPGASDNLPQEATRACARAIIDVDRH